MDASEIRLLIADDEYYICEGLREAMTKDGYRVDVAYDGNQAKTLMEAHEYDAAIFDLKMPGQDGLSLLKWVRGANREIGVIVITAYGEVETAVEAMRRGAYDYLTKPVDLKRLRLSLERLLDHQALVAENRVLRARLDSNGENGEIVHRSAAMEQVCDTVAQAAMTDVPVLITGETGTGKELVARAIHQASARRNAPLVAMNCGAFAETLFGSELFGYVKGAFTGATADKAGFFAAAEGGTLFFDEVGEIPLPNQVDLLRVLEEKAYRPVGSTRAVSADVRTIFVTNRDLEREVAEGRFREDLYYRINVVPIRLPPLRERVEDIPLLIDVFFDNLCALYHKARKELTPDAMDRVLAYLWPGNVRELKNAIERIVVTCADQKVDVDHLPSRIRDAQNETDTIMVELGSSLADVERALIEKTLAHVTANRKEAAALLGISVRALQYKIKAYNLR
ncbi:MAG: sigma-54-dependent Fis family transcriptional regulator [Gemmatimonadetes bacterium]|nr:sigma-54-dependent Fis family transcriptional regulator [Gemmatimonadota bacterium]MYK53876.1 sigma-54-dependent Fis family transcriptional regulator [Gemmatimonadota bacterium]